MNKKIKKVEQKVNAIILALSTLFTINYSKVKAKEDNGDYITQPIITESEGINKNNETEITYINKYINEKLEYYKNTNICEECILLLNYPYLEEIGYNIPSNINSIVLTDFEAIAFSPDGWGTIRLEPIINGETQENETSQDWYEIRKRELKIFSKAENLNRVLKYAPILLEQNEKNDADNIESLCYQIYQRYNETDGNIDDIKLNNLVTELSNALNKSGLFTNRSNGFYKVIVEILREFEFMFAQIDEKYNSLRGELINVICDCTSKYNYTTAYIINRGCFDDNIFGDYSYHPKTMEYNKMSEWYNNTIKQYSIKNKLENLFPEEEKFLSEIKLIKQYYKNRINTIYYNNEETIETSVFSSNSFELLNYTTINNNTLNNELNYCKYFIKEDYLFDNQLNYDLVYDDLKKIYIINEKILNEKFDPQNIQFLNFKITGNYTNILLPYSGLLLSQLDYNIANDIEKKYNIIENNFIDEIGICYNQYYQRNTGNSYNFLINSFYYENLDRKLEDIIETLNLIDKNNKALNLVVGIMSEQRIKHILSTIIENNDYEINGELKQIIIKKIEEIIQINNRLIGMDTKIKIMTNDEMNFNNILEVEKPKQKTKQKQ